jgi:phosphoadenylyl-sulfate reductase (thioredoxin)
VQNRAAAAPVQDRAAETLAFLEKASPEEMLQWAWEHHHERAAIFTGLQNTGCVMIDMAHRVAPELRVIAIDTLRLPKGTYELIDALHDRYGVTIERFEPDPHRLEEMIRQHGEYLFFDGRAKQELCCRVRKVEPNQRALETVDVWITGLRRDQSSGRASTPRAANYGPPGAPQIKVKLCPLADWTEEQAWDYIRRHNVPYNQLYDKGFKSIGCEICSTPTIAGEDARAGRWRWMNQLEDQHHKECGIHTKGSGI